MKIWKKTIIITILIIIWVTFWYFWDKDNKARLAEIEKGKLIYVVRNWDIKNEVKVTATAKLANEQNLSFWQGWKITKVYVKIWDEVKAWQILAELNMDDYENNIRTSELELENAKLWLTKLLNNDTSLRESQLNSQINEATANYDVESEQEIILKKQLETSLWEKNNNLEQLLRNYELDKKNLEITKSWLNVNTNIEIKQTESSLTSRKQTIDSIINSLNSSLWDIEQIVESIDKIYGVSDQFKDYNNDYENYLWVKDTNKKNETELNISEWYKLISNYTEQFNKIDSTSITDEEIYNLVQKYYNDTKILTKLCDNALDSIEQSVESLWSLSSTMIEWFKATANASRTNSINLRNQLETFSSSINSLLSEADQKDKLNNSIDQKNIDYQKLEDSLKKLGEQIVSLKKEIDNQIIDNKNQLNRKKSQNEAILEKIEVLKKELKDLLDWADEYDIKQQNNLISQANLRLEKVKDQEDNYQIIADFDWRVRTIDIVEWEQYKLDDRKYIVVENPNLVELELQVSQIDIVKIKEKDSVIVTFDAYPNNQIKSVVNNRNVNPESNGRWWVYYKASILLEKQNLEILAWMSALVTVTTNSAENILIIPSLSLIQEWDKKYVYIQQWEKFVKQEIKTWIINNFQAEVTEWIKQWDIIMSSVLDTEALKSMWIDDSSSKVF